MPRLGLGLMLAGLVLSFAGAARAAELDGVLLPDVQTVEGKTLHLNGYGLRSLPVLGIHLYVVGLYLEHTSSDPDAILLSPETKLLTVTFEHDVSAERARAAWRKGLENNCVAPCQLDPGDVAQFLAGVPAMHSGDTFNLRFAGHTAVIAVNGRPLGNVDKPMLADAILATFLGPKPASPPLRRALLAGHG